MGRSLKWSQPEPFQKLSGGHPKPVRTAAVLLLMILFPPFIIFIWYTMIHLEGSVERSYRFFQARGIRGLRDVWPHPTILACKIIGVFVTFEAVLLIFLPAERYIGPVSPAGNRPIYKKNGFVSYMVTLAVYYFLWKERLFNPGLVYDNIGEIFSVLVIASYAGAILLYFKGHMAPSSEDWGSSGNILGDLFWGMELYPRITSHFDIKVFLNCRFAVMTWAMLVISFAIKQPALGMFGAGLACNYIIYDCNVQRLLFINSNGKCRIWGKIPSKIQLHYVTEWGDRKHSLLLTAGWWSVARHFHLAPEIGLAICWSLPVLFKHAMPYFYALFVTATLVDRANRDDKRMKQKYHKFWEAHCKRVRYKIIPLIY
ncbi:unnamed protein product [Sphagnum balticum]